MTPVKSATACDACGAEVELCEFKEWLDPAAQDSDNEGLRCPVSEDGRHTVGPVPRGGLLDDIEVEFVCPVLNTRVKGIVVRHTPDGRIIVCSGCEQWHTAKNEPQS